MLKKAKALIPYPARLCLKIILESILHLPAIVRLKALRRKQRAINLVSRDRRITFISDAPSWREMKLAYGLRRAGWDVTLLHGKQALSLDVKSFHDVRQFQSPWEAVELAHQTKTRVFHNFSHFGDQASIRLLLHKPGRMIYDFYDNYFSMYDGLEISEEKKQLVADRLFCIEKADAICCRDMQMQYRRREKGIAKGKPVILFPEYCWNDGPLPERRPDREIHIVVVGWMGLETLGELDAGACRILEKFVNAGCHLHVYLHPIFPPLGSTAFEIAFADYLELGRKTGRVHIYPTVSPDKLNDELKKYDFGANVSNAFSFDMPWTSHNVARFPYCGASRLFDYLDAGLGMINHEQLKLMSRTFRSYGIIYDATALLGSADLRTELARRPDPAVFQRARTELSIDRNIGRLTQFYEKLR